MPELDVEIDAWLNGPNAKQVDLGFATTYLVSELGTRSSVAKSDYRWITNSIRVITSGMPEYESFLEFEVVERTHTYESSPLWKLLSNLLETGLIELRCSKCSSPVVSGGEPLPPRQQPRGQTRRCRRCGEPFDPLRAVYSLTEHGSSWLRKVEPSIQNEDFLSMVRSMTKGTRLLYRDGLELFDYASDFAVKFSELKLIQSRPSSSPMTVISNVSPSMDQVYVKVLRDLHSRGELLPPNTDALSISTQFGLSLGRAQGPQYIRQIRDYGFTLLDPTNRLVTNVARASQPPDLLSLAGQMVWYFSKTNELDPVKFYNPMAVRFSDDSKTISGSDYGYRLFSKFGDQVSAAIDRLRKDPSSRRTFCSIHDSHDSLVQSKDIPCPIGVEFLISGGKLHATTMMRSNNAYTLLPFNVMFFTYLQEIVAGELGLPLGTYHHFAVSLHYFSKDEARVGEAISSTCQPSGQMQSIQSHKPLEDIERLVALEKDARTSTLEGNFTFEELFRGTTDLPGSIRDLGTMVLMHCARTSKRLREYETLRSSLNPVLRTLVQPLEPKPV